MVEAFILAKNLAKNTINNSNKLFEHWRALFPIKPKDDNKALYWVVECIYCYRLIAFASRVLNDRFITKPCECQKKKIDKISTSLVGRRFGHLTVICKTNKKSYGTNCLYLCECDCGNETIVNSARFSLKNSEHLHCCEQCKDEVNTNTFKEIGVLKTKDLTGKKFGMFTVIKYVGAYNGNKGSVWECQCDCGTIKTIRSMHLTRTSNAKTHCGCMSYKKLEKGDVFNYLTVISETRTQKRNRVTWNCICKCGNNIIVNTSHLTSGAVKSCGCSYIDARKKKSEKAKLTRKINNTEDNRKSPEYIQWRNLIYKKNKYICQKCFKKGTRSNKIHAHHILSYVDNKDLRLDIANGICLCKKCHDNFHRIYGSGRNTKEQLEEFFSNVLSINESSVRGRKKIIKTINRKIRMLS